MSACVVWIDSQNAKVFSISPKGIQHKSLKMHGAEHSGGHHDAHKKNSEEHFFHEVASAVGSVEELLVFGPGVAKNHFKSHLEKHHHAQLAKHLVGCESLEQLSDNQILEAARKFFKKYNTYHVSI